MWTMKVLNTMPKFDLVDQRRIRNRSNSFKTSHVKAQPAAISISKKWPPGGSAVKQKNGKLIKRYWCTSVGCNFGLFYVRLGTRNPDNRNWTKNQTKQKKTVKMRNMCFAFIGNRSLNCKVVPVRHQSMW